MERVSRRPERGDDSHALGIQLTDTCGAVLQAGETMTSGVWSLPQEGYKSTVLLSSQNDWLLITLQWHVTFSTIEHSEETFQFSNICFCLSCKQA